MAKQPQPFDFPADMRPMTKPSMNRSIQITPRSELMVSFATVLPRLPQIDPKTDQTREKKPSSTHNAETNGC